jgi:hypothetical protein
MRGINDDNLRLQCYKKQKSLWKLLEDKRRATILTNKDWQTCRRHLQQNKNNTKTVTPGRTSALKHREAAKRHHEAVVEANTRCHPMEERKQ